jgi:hypothetical protein
MKAKPNQLEEDDPGLNVHEVLREIGRDKLTSSQEAYPAEIQVLLDA